MAEQLDPTELRGPRVGRMNIPRYLWNMALAGPILSGCAASPLFAPEVLEDVDRTLTFATLQTNPNAYGGSKIELGGQIVGSRADPHELRILVRELPIQTQPAYGPVETETLRGMFVVVYSDELTAQDLQHGNMIVLVGRVMGAVWDAITGSPVARPTVQAECLHIWRVGGERIDDYPWPPSLEGYWPLVEQTFCANRPGTLLYLSQMAYPDSEAR